MAAGALEPFPPSLHIFPGQRAVVVGVAPMRAPVGGKATDMVISDITKAAPDGACVITCVRTLKVTPIVIFADPAILFVLMLVIGSVSPSREGGGAAAVSAAGVAWDIVDVMIFVWWAKSLMGWW